VNTPQPISINPSNKDEIKIISATGAGHVLIIQKGSPNEKTMDAFMKDSKGPITIQPDGLGIFTTMDAAYVILLKAGTENDKAARDLCVKFGKKLPRPTA
jgi:hypothetical protein